MFWTYIIYSKSWDKYYVGHSQYLNSRIQRHNEGLSRSTKAGIPWELVYCEKFKTRVEAIRRERQIKGWKSRKMIEKLVRSYPGVSS